MTARHANESTLEHVRLLLERADEAPTLQALAEAASLSPSHLQRAFRRRYGMSPAEHAVAAEYFRKVLALPADQRPFAQRARAHRPEGRLHLLLQ